MLLETYSATPAALAMPACLAVAREVTGDPSFSMFNLSKTSNVAKGVE